MQTDPLARLRVVASLFAMAVSLCGQTYDYELFAGRPRVGCIDGTRGDARFNYPMGIAVDPRGDLLVADTFNHTIRKITVDGVVTTVAGGTGLSGRLDGIGPEARFCFPFALAADGAGNILVADTYNHTIRRIIPTGEVSTLAGRPGEFGVTNGIGRLAQFAFPSGIAVDASGSVYVADSSNSTIRRISPGGIVSTLAGEGRVAGQTDGAGAEARFGYPQGLALADNGDLFVHDAISDPTGRGTYIHAIRRIRPDGSVSTLADSRRTPGLGDPLALNGALSLAVDPRGTVITTNPRRRTLVAAAADGTVTTLDFSAARQELISGVSYFSIPNAVTRDHSGNLYVADSGAHSIRRVSPLLVLTTLAGSHASGGPRSGTGGLARFGSLTGVTRNSTGTIFVSDSSYYLIWKVTAEGVVTTFAGLADSRGSIDGAASVARFQSPNALAGDGRGNLIVADGHSIRRVSAEGEVMTLAGNAIVAGNADGEGVSARFNLPRGMAVDQEGTCLVADQNNHVIRKVSPRGHVTTFAGQPGVPGSNDGPATQARFTSPDGLAIDREGNLFVADRDAHVIRRISPDGNVSTYAGNPRVRGSLDGVGATAQFSEPRALAIDPEGALLVADANGIRRITGDLRVSTIGRGGVGLTFNNAERGPRSVPAYFPSGLAVAPDGALFISDSVGPSIIRGIPTSDPARLINVSVMATLAGEGDSLTLGAVIGGAGSVGTTPLLVRAAGPALEAFGVTDALPDPRVEIFRGETVTAENEDWGGAAGLASAFAQVGAFPFGSPKSKDSALLLPAVLAGAQTARVSGRGTQAGGSVLVEIYDVRRLETRSATSPRLVNVSVLKEVGNGVTAGIAVGGKGMKTLLFRAIGPSLAQFGVKEPLSDPILEVFDGDARVIAANDDWMETVSPQLSSEWVFKTISSVSGAFPLSTARWQDSAVMATLPNGTYTVQVRGVGGGRGSVLIEIYELP